MELKGDRVSVQFLTDGNSGSRLARDMRLLVSPLRIGIATRDPCGIVADPTGYAWA